MVEATGHIPDALIEAFEKGISIEDVYYKAQAVERLGSRLIRVVLVEGKNREIRRVFSHFHLHPFRLRRVRIGPVKLEDLPEGESRPLKKFELEALKIRNEERNKIRNEELGMRNKERKESGRLSRKPIPNSSLLIPHSPKGSLTW